MNLQERLEFANAEKEDFYKIIEDLPVLNGSEKQIVWANDLRNCYIEKMKDFLSRKFNKKRLTPIIINLISANILLKNTTSAKFYIDNCELCKSSNYELANQFIHLKIKRPDVYDCSTEYLEDLLRKGGNVNSIKKMLI